MNVEDESRIREQSRSLLSAGDLFASDQEAAQESGAPQSALAWLRLAVALACVGLAVFLTAHRFLDHVIHHVWNQSRNSPSALIVPVLVVEFMWIIAHVHTGGPVARLKIGLGAAVFCVALFSPNPHFVGGSSSARSLDTRQLVALVLSAWVFIDGWRDRRSNLRHDQSHDLASQRP